MIDKIKMKILYIIIANDIYRNIFEEKKQYHSIKIKQYVGVFRYNDYIIRIDDCPYSFIDEQTVVNYCKQNNYNAILCGHIHKPEFVTINNIKYLNTGDWIENNSFIVETLDGNIELHKYEDFFGNSN